MAVGQGHDDRRTGDRRADSGGVSDGATFSHSGVSRQFHGRGVDGVSHIGHGWRRAWHQVFEVATRGVLDRDFDFAGVFVDIIGRRRNGHGAGSFARFDGDHRAVAQGHGDRAASGIGQGRGVGDLAAFSHGSCRAQRQVGGIDGVGDGGADRGFVGHEVFVIAAGNVGDRVGQWSVASQRIVRRSGGHGAGGFTHFDGDVLTVGQGHHNWRTGHWCANSGGVGDGATFSGRLGGGQFDRRGINGIGHIGYGWCGARNQILEVATRSILDGHFDLASVFVDVIGWSRHGHGAGGLARFDGDHRAVRQGHSHRGAGRVGQGRGVNNRTAFSHGAGRSQRQVGGVDGVSNSGRNRGFVGDQILVVTAAYVSDCVVQRGVAVQRIVRRYGGCGARGLANTDSDGLAVGQRHDHWRTGHWRADSRGVGNGATFSGRFGGGQFDRRGIDGVGDVGNGRNGAWHQILEVAASRVFDGDFDFAGVFIDVIGRRSDGHGASGLARFDGDDRTVRQGHGHRGAGRVGQGRGVNDRTAFRHSAGGAERQVGGVGGVSDSGADRSLVGNEVFVVAAADVGDRVGQRCMTVQRIVRCGGGHGASGFADFDGDVLTIGQSHDHWRTGHW